MRPTHTSVVRIGLPSAAIILYVLWIWMLMSRMLMSASYTVYDNEDWLLLLILFDLLLCGLGIAGLALSLVRGFPLGLALTILATPFLH